ncbi:hypothetical protein [Kushneria marisflavi]|uniref:Uncharacterized protein n=1 Tax=Kushneria marisflavi TaxID=157779 RepID=A0A240UNG1_9GAMM|nr:hypothetical protein [Kushneria marisflavi]ART62560.1 hypothetical protein B9H00_05425 [Kushneria marisflavi]RKD84066.1 hypothetical protein C8D96_2921 [Kushneria marisflavi]
MEFRRNAVPCRGASRLAMVLAGTVMGTTTAFGEAVTDLDYIDPGIQQPTASHELFNDRENGIRLSGGLSFYGYSAATRNVNFGSSSGIDGATPTGRHPSWWELSATPTLRGEIDTGQSVVFAGVVGVGSMTRGSAYGDASGATPDHPEHTRLDQAYIGWRSGSLLSDSLGKDALTFSFGRQQFMFGEGFLVGDGYTDTGKYGGYWNGPSQGFKNAAIASIDSHGWHGDLFHLEQDQYVQGGPDEETSANGINAEYTFTDRAKIGGAWLRTYDSDIAGRDGMEVWNVRLKGRPLADVPGLALGGQYVSQKNRDADIDDDGWYVQATYTFQNAPWSPEIAYRHARFSENYDTLFYEFAGGWGNWFMGEITGEYMLFNTNMKIDMLRASVSPRDDLETGIIGYRFRLDDPQSVGASDADFAKEINLYADWNISEQVTLSGVYAVSFPDEGARARFGGNDHTSQLLELFATYTF